MKQKKRVWMSFNLWEANVFEQYLEEMAAQGWFLESVGGSVMKFHRAEPAKRRYAALLVPGSSSLTGADSWKAEQFRKQCQEAGWNFECSGTFWQIFYTTDDAVERAGDMTEEKQFLIQKSLSGTWSVKLCYPVLIVLEAWAVYRYLQNPGKLFSDSMLLLLNLLMVGIFVSWIVSYVRIFWWVYKTTSAFKKGEPLPKMDLRRKVNFKKRIILFDGILILGGLAFSSSMSAFVGFMISSVLIVAISFFMRNWIRNNGSGDNRDDWIGYLVGVAVVCMITIPLCNAATSHFLGEEEPEEKDEKWLLGRIRCGIRHAIEEQTQRKFEDDYLVAKVEKLEAAVRELTEDEEDESSKFSVEELAIILDMDEEEIRDVLRLTGDDK